MFWDRVCESSMQPKVLEKKMHIIKSQTNQQKEVSYRFSFIPIHHEAQPSSNISSIITNPFEHRTTKLSLKEKQNINEVP